MTPRTTNPYKRALQTLAALGQVFTAVFMAVGCSTYGSGNAGRQLITPLGPPQNLEPVKLKVDFQKAADACDVEKEQVSVFVMPISRWGRIAVGDESFDFRALKSSQEQEDSFPLKLRPGDYMVIAAQVAGNQLLNSRGADISLSPQADNTVTVKSFPLLLP